MIGLLFAEVYLGPRKENLWPSFLRVLFDKFDYRCLTGWELRRWFMVMILWYLISKYFNLCEKLKSQEH